MHACDCNATFYQKYGVHPKQPCTCANAGPSTVIAPQPSQTTQASTVQPTGFKRCLNIFLAEVIGTLILVFVGCVGCVSHAYINFTAVLSCINFGIAVLIACQAIGHISGGHLNPSVTIGALVMGLIELKLVPVYILAQFLGAMLGFGLLVVCIPYDFREIEPGVCSTVPTVDWWQALLIEFLATGIFVFALCGLWDVRNAHKSDSALIRVFFIISACFIISAPFTGASLNTPRSLAPAIFNLDFSYHWIYWVAPNLGALVWSLLYKFLFAIRKPGKKKTLSIQTSKPQMKGSGRRV